MTSRHTTRAYRGALLRLIRSAEIASQVCGRPTTFADLIHAMVARSQILAKQSVNIEIAGLRHHLRDLEAKGAPEVMVWDAEIDTRPWMTEVDWEEWQEVFRFALLRRTDMNKEAGTILTQLHEDATEAGLDGSVDEMVDQIAAVTYRGPERQSFKDMRLVGAREMTIVEMALSLADPHQAIFTTTSAKPLDAKGLTRIFATTIWATGMRPVEVWESRLFVPRQDIEMTDEIRDLIRNDPRAALVKKHLVAVEQLPRSPTESYGAVVLTAMRQTGAPAILVIRSAKQANANPTTRAEVRVQILENIPMNMATMIAVASQLRHLNVPRDRRDYVRKAVNETLKEISANEPALEGFSLTLYAFRHAFATRVKRAYGLAEAAALTGHTSTSSLYAYGKRRAVGGANSAGGQAWVPKADPVHAGLIRAAWDIAEEPEAAPKNQTAVGA